MTWGSRAVAVRPGKLEGARRGPGTHRGGRKAAVSGLRPAGNTPSSPFWPLRAAARADELPACVGDEGAGCGGGWLPGSPGRQCGPGVGEHCGAGLGDPHRGRRAATIAAVAVMLSGCILYIDRRLRPGRRRDRRRGRPADQERRHRIDHHLRPGNIPPFPRRRLDSTRPAGHALRPVREDRRHPGRLVRGRRRRQRGHQPARPGLRRPGQPRPPPAPCSSPPPQATRSPSGPWAAT